MTTALIVIDVQQGFADSKWGPRNNPAAEDNIVALTAAWQQARDPIVVVRHDSVEPASPLRPDQPGNDLQPMLDGIRPALLFGKHVNSAFHGEVDLHAWLTGRRYQRDRAVRHPDEYVRRTTTRVAGNLGYDATLAIDATYTFDAKGPDGAVLERRSALRGHCGKLARRWVRQGVHTAVVLADRA